MISRGMWVLLAVVACDGRAPSARHRVLEQIPAAVAGVVVADGAALGHPRVRQVVDVLRPELPASIGCAIDAALAGDELALGIGADRAFTLVVATSGDVKCAALSRVAPGLYVATLGGGQIAAGQPVLASAAFERARPYLQRAPIAVAMAFEGGELIGTAQPAPLAAWLTIDTSDALAPVLESALRTQLARMGSDPATSPFAAHIALTREGPQVAARLSDTDADLAAAVRTLRAWAKARPRAATRTAACPAMPRDPITGCDGDALVTRSLRAALALVTAAPLEPVVANAIVSGMRLTADVPPLGLTTGDVLVGAAGQQVRSRKSLGDALAGAKGEATLTVRRGARDRVIRIVERARE